MEFIAAVTFFTILFAIPFVSTYLLTSLQYFSSVRRHFSREENRKPIQVPYAVPLIGHALGFLAAALLRSLLPDRLRPDRLRPYFDRLRPYFDRLRPYFDRLWPYFDRLRPYFDRLRPYSDFLINVIPMFGVFRYNENVQANPEIIDLSEENGVELRSHAILVSSYTCFQLLDVANADMKACNQCRERKLRCTGESYQCRRCQATSTVCTYQRHPISSKRYLSASNVDEASNPPSKKLQSTTNAHHEYHISNTSSRDMSLEHGLLSRNPGDGFWTPVSLLGSHLNETCREWDHIQQEGNRNQHTSRQGHSSMIPTRLPASEILSVNVHQEASSIQNTSDEDSRQSSTRFSKAAAAANPLELEGQEGRCRCISALANSLERISGDTGNDVDKNDCLDYLLIHLHDGIKTCKNVLSCNRCSLSTTNPMFLVTIMQQLATISQALSLQLVRCQQRGSATSSNSEFLQSLYAGIYIGEYKVQATSLHLKFLVPIASMYLKDLQQLLERLQNNIKKGKKTFGILGAAADIVKKAYENLNLN
ncbi:hypothetical protein GQ44DRAFT_722910 [Phaeosphaeriaceae sp. PMI808]|nr:hypothetical protein GQ44DRAFT_722910 [Phaeosphaeriaceae sp. PMI808]